MLLIYFFVNCNILEVSQLLLNAQVSNGYFIATFSENVKNHKYLASNFERIFDPQGGTTTSYAKGIGELWPTFE